MNKQITQELINENLKRVENGEALTMPLSILNGEFKEAYFNPEIFRECLECGKRFKITKHFHRLCSNKCKIFYKQKNKDKIKAREKAYREKNKDKINAKRRKRYLKTGK